MSEPAKPPDPHCTWCGKARGLAICNGCVAFCVVILEETLGKEWTEHLTRFRGNARSARRSAQGAALAGQ